MKMTARTIARQPTTRYAIPRNEFFPPAQLVVEKTIAFRPPKAVTGYATICYCTKSVNKLTVVYNNIIGSFW